MEVLEEEEVLKRPILPAEAKNFMPQGIWPDNKFTDKKGDSWVPILWRAMRYKQRVGRRERR